MKKLTLAIAAFPVMFVGGAVVLFTAGFIAHMMIGKENPIEELSENLLKDEYGVDVEFSNENK